MCHSDGRNYAAPAGCANNFAPSIGLNETQKCRVREIRNRYLVIQISNAPTIISVKFLNRSISIVSLKFCDTEKLPFLFRSLNIIEDHDKSLVTEEMITKNSVSSNHLSGETQKWGFVSAPKRSNKMKGWRQLSSEINSSSESYRWLITVCEPCQCSGCKAYDAVILSPRDDPRISHDKNISTRFFTMDRRRGLERWGEDGITLGAWINACPVFFARACDTDLSMLRKPYRGGSDLWCSWEENDAV